MRTITPDCIAESFRDAKPKPNTQLGTLIQKHACVCSCFNVQSPWRHFPLLFQGGRGGWRFCSEWLLEADLPLWMSLCAKSQKQLTVWSETGGDLGEKRVIWLAWVLLIDSSEIPWIAYEGWWPVSVGMNDNESRHQPNINWHPLVIKIWSLWASPTPTIYLCLFVPAIVTCGQTHVTVTLKMFSLFFFFVAKRNCATSLPEVAAHSEP